MLSSSCQSQWSACGTAVKRQCKAESMYRQVNAERKWGSWPHGARAILATFRKLARKSETPYSALKIPGCIVRNANGLVLGLGITRVGTRTSWFRWPETQGGAPVCNFDLGFHGPGDRRRLGAIPEETAFRRKAGVPHVSGPGCRRHSGVKSAVNNREHRGPNRVRLRDSKRLGGAQHLRGQADSLQPQAAGFQNCAGCGIQQRSPSVSTIHRYAASTKRGVENFLAAYLPRNRPPPKQTKPDRNAEDMLVSKFEAWEWPMQETGPASQIVRRQMPRRLWANGQGLGK